MLSNIYFPGPVRAGRAAVVLPRVRRPANQRSQPPARGASERMRRSAPSLDGTSLCTRRSFAVRYMYAWNYVKKNYFVTIRSTLIVCLFSAVLVSLHVEHRLKYSVTVFSLDNYYTIYFRAGIEICRRLDTLYCITG